MGPLRFRGEQDEQRSHRRRQKGVREEELFNLEQQTFIRKHYKDSSCFKKLFRCPQSFCAPDWTPGCWVLIVFAVFCLIAILVCKQHATLPSVPSSTDSSATNDGSRRFMAMHAQADLNELINIGPRPTGSKGNEVLAVNFLRNKISEIKKELDGIQKISSADQEVTGSFYLNITPMGYVSVYDHVQNIVVRLTSGSQRRSSAVLLNCHFDSVPGSPGAGDDGFHCAVMLEILRVLYHSKKKFLHDVIFLFNGAEETMLQASHGFITQHEWAKDIKAFINLEGCGAGGKEILFQTGPNSPWLVETYAKQAPHPHGTVMAEEMFQNGLIPSDTDFRIFRDFGHVPGFDFANVANGFVYHTKYDNGKLISPGSYQHTGDNVLALVYFMASSPHLDLVNSSGYSMVYFDLLGMYFVQYSQKFGTNLNFIVSALSMISVVIHLFSMSKGMTLLTVAHELKNATFGILLGWIFAVLYIFLLTDFLNWANLTQSWYHSYLFQFCLYNCSTVLFSVLGPFVMVHQSKVSNIHQAQFSYFGTQFLWTIFLLIGTSVGVRSSYLVLFIVLSATLGNFALTFYGSQRNLAKPWVLMQITVAIIPLIMGIYHTLLAMAVFVPITNRAGSHMNAELVIGLLSAATTIFSICFLVPLSLYVRHQSVLVSIGMLHVIGLAVLIVFQPLPFYEWQSTESGVPQRVPLWHVQRTLYNVENIPRYSDSGFWMMNMDRSSPHYLRDIVEELKSGEKAANLCEQELFCALPLSSPRMINYLNDSLWIPGPKPFGEDILGMISQKSSLTPSMTRITFNVSGPPQMSFMFAPYPGITASRWSLQANLTSSTIFKERPAYFIFYQRGLPQPLWTFSVDFEHEENIRGPLATVAAVGSHIDSDLFSTAFNRFMQKFPLWAFISPRASELKIWEV